MISKKHSGSIPLRKSQFSISGIILNEEEPKRFAVNISIPGFLYSIESTLTGNQLFSYSEFQKVIASEHGVFAYVTEIDQARGTHKRSQLWRAFINSHLPELV
ncbi:hypothetical protein Pan153_33950 [Gimesia panareensis]|uniref:Uncharacterized protein n=1 Tax=Gimesia panareensis TaxID=2527978 RepID=A0A518FQW4_9PLAN|nr:hypothetical protein Pan153_33950 [Gimesia panareensis]